MIIKLPIDNDRDFEVIMAILDPELFNIDYATLKARELYYSLTPEQIETIKEDIAGRMGECLTHS